MLWPLLSFVGAIRVGCLLPQRLSRFTQLHLSHPTTALSLRCIAAVVCRARLRLPSKLSDQRAARSLSQLDSLVSLTCSLHRDGRHVSRVNTHRCSRPLCPAAHVQRWHSCHPPQPASEFAPPAAHRSCVLCCMLCAVCCVLCAVCCALLARVCCVVCWDWWAATTC